MNGLMILGTASDVGKSIIMTAVCRMLANDGVLVAPFKSQNMSNYLFKLNNGKVISRAQAIQAEAAMVEPVEWMNPIVLHMKKHLQAEVFMLGNLIGTVTGRMYREQFYEKGLEVITHSLAYLQNHYDVIIMEGAGSPVELNLKDKELVNMKVAELADVPVILVADIDRGGVFASIVGTLSLLTEKERKRVKGIIINKFQGDRTMFQDGIEWLEQETNIPVLGLIPFIQHNIEPEDSLSMERNKLQNGQMDLQVMDKYNDLVQKIQNDLDYSKLKSIMKRWHDR